MPSQKIAYVGIENIPYCNGSLLYSYIVPDSLTDLLSPGMRVLVPFGKGDRLRQGFVFRITDESNEDIDGRSLKLVHSTADSTPLLSEELIMLAEWLQDRCFCSYFIAAKSLLPGGVCLKSEKVYCCTDDIAPDVFDSLSDDEKLIITYLRKKKNYVRESLILKKVGLDKNSPILKKMTRRGMLKESAEVFSGVKDLSVQLVRLIDYPEDEVDVVITDKQRSVINVLRDIGAATVKELCYFSGVSESVVKSLISKSVCETFSSPVKRELNFSNQAEYKKPVLSQQQKGVFEQLLNAYRIRDKSSALLYGVTGSGKTSVYLELIDKVIEDGKTAIVLVPEISLTPQTFGIFSARYGKNVAVLHSGLSMGERYDEWKRIKEGAVKVVIGTRSAVFAPLENIGLIVIDEEQEHTYKSEMSPRYNAKDVAKFRCAYNNAFLLLASATPSVETYAKAQNGHMMLCELESRYGSAVLPDVYTVDMTDKKLLSSFFSVSDPLAEEIRKNLENKEQSILLVNRRGYNTFVVCSDCKKVVTCPNCSISMTYHSANNRLMCHYCGYSIPYAVKCPSCGAENIRYSGAGTQKVEQELKIRFPEARVLRMDADTTTAKNAHEKALAAFANGDYDILIGTQMVAKGLDFPDVTLVGITCADKELYNNDFRSAERSFDLITQVVGRAGRGKRKGRAVIQTVSPDNNIIRIASMQDYKSFFKSEIVMRKALVYPPFCDLCEIGFSAESDKEVNDAALQCFDRIVELNKSEYADQKIIILGPMPPRVSKINGNYRRRILIKCKNSPRFRKMINIAITECQCDKKRNVSVFADINPEKLN